MTANFTAADDVDVIDHRCVQRKNALDANTETHLANRNGLTNAAVFDRNADAFKCLKPFFVSFLNANAHAKCVARLECRYILFNLLFLDKIQSVHF